MEGVYIFLDTLVIVVAIFLIVALRFTIKSYEKSSQEGSSQDNDKDEIEKTDDVKMDRYFICALKERHPEDDAFEHILTFGKQCNQIEDFSSEFCDSIQFNHVFNNGSRRLLGVIPKCNILYIENVERKEEE